MGSTWVQPRLALTKVKTGSVNRDIGNISKVVGWGALNHRLMKYFKSGGTYR